MARLQATIVEVNRRTVGVAVKTRLGFRFFAAGREFAHLEGQVFRRMASVFQAVRGSGFKPSSPAGRDAASSAT
jgi:hypothetical protein